MKKPSCGLSLVLCLAGLLGLANTQRAEALGPWSSGHCTVTPLHDYTPNGVTGGNWYTTTARYCASTTYADHGLVTGQSLVYKFVQGQSVTYLGFTSSGWYLRNYGWVPCARAFNVNCGGI